MHSTLLWLVALSWLNRKVYMMRLPVDPFPSMNSQHVMFSLLEIGVGMQFEVISAYDVDI